MRFTTPTERILTATLTAERIVGKKESLPVLSCILLEVQKDLVVRATNLEAGIEIRVPGEVGEVGVVAVPAGIFSQTLRAVSGDKVVLTVENGNLTIESRGSKTLIKGVPHEEFPAFTANHEGGGFTVGRTLFLKALQSVSYAASASMIRPELGSIYIALKDAQLTTVATDSFRLAEKQAVNTSGKGECDVLLPLKHAQELVHVLERLGAETVQISLEESQLLVVADSVRFVSRIVDGTFPNYREIIPKNFTTEVTVLKSDFAETLRKARVFAGTEQHVGFHVYPQKKVFDVTAQSPSIGEMSDTLESALQGDDVDVNFHIGYVADCLQSIESDSVKLGFSGTGRPLVISGVSDSSFTYLVMPLNR